MPSSHADASIIRVYLVPGPGIRGHNVGVIKMDKFNVIKMTLSSTAVLDNTISEGPMSEWEAMLDETLLKRLKEDSSLEIVDKPGPYFYINPSASAMVITVATGETIPTSDGSQAFDSKLDAVLNLTRRVFARPSVQEQPFISQMIIRTTPQRVYLVVPDVVKSRFQLVKEAALADLGIPKRIAKLARLNPRMTLIFDDNEDDKGDRVSLKAICKEPIDVYTFEEECTASTLQVFSKGDTRVVARASLCLRPISCDLVIPVTAKDTPSSGRIALALISTIWERK